MPDDIFYLVYHDYHGQVCVQTWWGEVTQNGRPMENVLAKIRITEQEFNLPLEVLKRFYPYNG